MRSKTGSEGGCIVIAIVTKYARVVTVHVFILDLPRSLLARYLPLHCLPKHTSRPPLLPSRLSTGYPSSCPLTRISIHYRETDKEALKEDLPSLINEKGPRVPLKTGQRRASVSSIYRYRPQRYGENINNSLVSGNNETLLVFMVATRRLHKRDVTDKYQWCGWPSSGRKKLNKWTTILTTIQKLYCIWSSRSYLKDGKRKYGWEVVRR